MCPRNNLPKSTLKANLQPNMLLKEQKQQSYICNILSVSLSYVASPVDEIPQGSLTQRAQKKNKKLRNDTK